MSEDSLEPLVTRCPNCDTRFRVSEAQLRVAAGRVRCGACLSVFDGTEHLILDGEEFKPDPTMDLDALLAELDSASITAAEPEPQIEPAPPAASAEAPIAEPVLAFEPPLPASVAQFPAGGERRAEDVAGDLAVLEQQLLDDLRKAESAYESTAEVPEQLGTVIAEAEESAAIPAKAKKLETAGRITVNLPDLRGADLQDEIEGSAVPARNRRWLAILTGLLLLIGLPAQILWFQFPSWVQEPQIRPLYEFTCRVLTCTLPPLRDVEAITSQKSVIRAHPDRIDARIVDVLMINNAAFDQPFPLIELRATSLDGQLIAARRFNPAEYLQGELARSGMMPVRTPVHVSLEIQDPGGLAMNFAVNFR